MSQITKTETVKLLGLLVTVTVPATVEYRDEIVGGGSIDELNSNDIYRPYAGKWRTEFFKAAALKGLTAVAGETDKTTVTRWVSSGLTTQADLQSIADEVTSALDFIQLLATSGQRATIGKQYVEDATNIVNSWGKPHPDNAEIICSAERTQGILRTMLPTLTFSDEPDVQEVAYALRDFQKAREEQAKRAMY